MTLKLFKTKLLKCFTECFNDSSNSSQNTERRFTVIQTNSIFPVSQFVFIPKCKETKPKKNLDKV